MPGPGFDGGAEKSGLPSAVDHLPYVCPTGGLVRGLVHDFGIQGSIVWLTYGVRLPSSHLPVRQGSAS